MEREDLQERQSTGVNSPSLPRPRPKGGRKRILPDFDVIERYARAGLTDYQLALCLRISEHTLSKWKRDAVIGPLIQEAIKKGLAQANERVQQSLYRRAVGYAYEKITYDEKVDKNGTVIPVKKKEIVEFAPSEVAAMMWLSNKDPENWKQRQDIGLTQNTRIIPVELSKLDAQARVELLERFRKEAQKRGEPSKPLELPERTATAEKQAAQDAPGDTNAAGSVSQEGGS